MKLIDLLATGWAEIRAHKMRSFLSFFAIAIGIATFFYTLSILSQRYRDIERAVELAGKGRLDVSTEHPLDTDQYQELKNMLPEGTSLSFVTEDSFERMYYKNNTISSFLNYGVFPSWADSNFVYRLEGRFINYTDIENKNRVIVLMVFPHEKEERDFWKWSHHNSDEDPPQDIKDFTYRHNLLGQQVTMNDESFTVVGILHAPETKDDPRFPEEKERIVPVFIPHTTWYELQPAWQENFSEKIRVITGDERTVRQAANTVTTFLRSQFGKNEKPEIKFFHETAKARTKEAREDLNNMLFLGLIAMIAGGIGIMNVTMAVIFSRTKEIGIRRALGATRRDILTQFLVEAMLLGFCGSIAGMVLGYGAVLHLAVNTKEMTFSWWVVVLSVLIAISTSFIFALYPAWKASNLKPVDALKYE